MNQTIKHAGYILYLLLFLILAILIIGLSWIYRLVPKSYDFPITAIDQGMVQVEDLPPNQISLPVKLHPIPHNTKVIFSSEFKAQKGDSLQIKSVFSPIRLFLDDQLVYEMGQKDSYPSYMNDPPTLLTMLPLLDYEGTTNIRIEYLSLSQRNTLALSKILIGNELALLVNQFKTNGLSIFFALILILLGTGMLLISLTILRSVPASDSFYWLSLFSLSTGIWVLGECELTAFLLPYPVLLYHMAYLGLFTLAIPFLHFGLVLLKPKIKFPIKGMLVIHYLSVTLALALQFLGIMDFTRTLYWFHIITPLAFIVFALCLLYEYFKYQTLMVKRFAFATSLLAVSTILELLNYWLQFTELLTIFFQLGVLTYVVFLSIISGKYIRESIFIAAEKSRLEFEMTALNRQLELQRSQYLKMGEDDAAVKAQRHDLRHQLTVLLELNRKEQREKLEIYLHTLLGKIPSDKEIRLCENYAVNAVASYYTALAMNEDIHMDWHFAIPKILDPLIESDLCIIIGNLLENALEACNRMNGDQKFIHLQSHMSYHTLVLSVENSFEGNIQVENGTIQSSKRDGEGIGLSSIEAIVKKRGGTTRVESKDGIFTISLYLQIDTLELEKELSI